MRFDKNSMAKIVIEQGLMGKEIIAEGKTKIVYATTNPNLVFIVSKDDITAGDGLKHDIVSGKGKLSNITTSNVFRLLKQCHIPVAFKEQHGDKIFVSERCEMIPYEVVVRREAHGSYLKRNPHLEKGHIFPKLIVEFFLKTSGRNWEGQDIPCDDPLVNFYPNERVELFIPNQPISQQEPFLILKDFPLKKHNIAIENMSTIARLVFLILEKSWELNGKKLVDFKVEFGFGSQGELLLADVIDNDSWRVIDKGEYMDKQLYRDGGNLNDVTARYQEVAEATKTFKTPRQQIIMWRASEKDDLQSFEKAIDPYRRDLTWTTVTGSLHKQPIDSIKRLTRLIQKIPNTVVIVCCGRSNGAGPTISANCTVPVITVPSGWKDFPEDVWSSLRSPSDTPVMTILEAGNAILASLQILALQNPSIYAKLRIEQEYRFCNM